MIDYLIKLKSIQFVPTSKSRVYETLRSTGGIAVLESLDAQLKEKERFILIKKDFFLIMNFKALEKRRDALLTMYGEKLVETYELRLDLADVKILYRAQVCLFIKQ